MVKEAYLIKRLEKIIKLTVIFTFTSSVVIFCLFPYFWMWSTSLRSDDEIMKPNPTIFPGHITFSQYIKVFTKTKFSLYLFNSIYIVTTSTVITLLISVLAAYALSRFKLRFKNVIQSWIIFTYLFPAMLTIVPLFFVWARLKLLDNHLSLIITYMVLGTPATTLLIKSFLDTVPIELEESALIDGCGRLKALFYITLPVSLPGIIASGVYAYITLWQEFTAAFLFLNSDFLRTLPPGLIVAATGEYSTDYGILMAGCSIAVLPVTIVFLIFEKYIIKGLFAGAVKR